MLIPSSTGACGQWCPNNVAGTTMGYASLYSGMGQVQVETVVSFEKPKQRSQDLPPDLAKEIGSSTEHVGNFFVIASENDPTRLYEGNAEMEIPSDGLQMIVEDSRYFYYKGVEMNVLYYLAVDEIRKTNELLIGQGYNGNGFSTKGPGEPIAVAPLSISNEKSVEVGGVSAVVGTGNSAQLDLVNKYNNFVADTKAEYASRREKFVNAMLAKGPLSVKLGVNNLKDPPEKYRNDMQTGVVGNRNLFILKGLWQNIYDRRVKTNAYHQGLASR